jgi:hypothetical protein
MAATNKKFQEEIWLGHYNDLIKFQKKTGLPHPGPKDSEIKLYHWCKNQRRFHKTGKLAEHRTKLLDKANFSWVNTNSSFDQRVKQLLDYETQHGTLHVSQVAFEKDSDNHKLSRWVNEMRRLYNENRLSIERINGLNKIGFIWNMEDERFSRNLIKLKRYYKQNGHWDVPQAGRAKKLGEWVAQVRCRGLAKPHYVKALNEVGFIWEGKKIRLRKAKGTIKEIDIYSKLKTDKKKLKKN